MTEKEKHELAASLTAAASNGFVVRYEPSYLLRGDDGEPDSTSLGHAWSAGFWDEGRMDDDPNTVWLDDRTPCGIETLLSMEMHGKEYMYQSLAVVFNHRAMMSHNGPSTSRKAVCE